MNIVLLIGRLTQDVEIKQVGERSVATITLAVRRDFKNSDGQFDTDFIPVTLWEGLAQTCSECCHKGTAVSLKGRLAYRKREKEDKTSFYQLEIIGEKIALLPTKETNEE